MSNPIETYRERQAALTQARYDAKYEDDLNNFREGCAQYPLRAEHQWNVDKTILAPPTVPIRQTCKLVNGVVTEGYDQPDPNLHAPVFVPPVVPKPTGLPDISKYATLDEVAAMVVMLADKIDSMSAKLDALVAKG